MKKLKHFFYKLAEYPELLISLLSKEIALELDKQYEGHIRYSKEFYIISKLDGTVKRVYLDKNSNFSYIAVFRTKEDALTAISILMPFLDSMY